MTNRERGRTLVTSVVVLAMALSIPAAFVAAGGGPTTAPQAQVAGPSGQDAPSNYSVQQGENCTEIVPVTSDETVTEFYDYRTPFPDNNYSNASGTSNSSEGTIELQQVNGSILFLHQNATGTLSLVAVHGSLNETSQAGSASFTVTGLPANGTWAVKDDEHDRPNQIDNWSHENGTATIDWTWNHSRTDGFAFAGLGEAFNVTIEPAFNENATLYQDYYNGTVENWTVVSNESTASVQGESDASVERTELNLTGNVSISATSCDDIADEGGAGITPEPVPAPDEDNTDSETVEPETDEPETETEEPETETEEPETETEEPEPETQAPDTQTEEPETETEEPETETEAPDTETEEPETETATPTDDGGSFPTVDAVMWDRDGASDDFFVEWVVSDDDGDLSQVTVELLQDNAVIASQSQSVSGSNAIATTQVSGEGADAVQVIVTDENGNQDDLRYAIGPPPTPDDEDGAGGAGQ